MESRSELAKFLFEEVRAGVHAAGLVVDWTKLEDYEAVMVFKSPRTL